jgi:hypothetical protein
MHVVKAMCCAAAITILAASGAHADEWNKKTYLTFSGPVQIPGATLQAGTYLFQLADPDNARHVVMVASKDGSKVYGMFITIPNDRMDTPDENVVLFGESQAGTPQAVQAWWYPGERTGEEFVYPRRQAVAIAKANHKEVLANESDVNANGSDNDRMAALRGSKVSRVDENGNMKGEPSNTTTAATTTAENTTAPAKTIKPNAETTTASAATTTAAPANTVDGRNMKAAKSTTARSNTAVGTAGQANTNTADNARTRRSKRTSLPRTASNLALFELLSALSLAGALTIRRLRATEPR